MSFYYLDDDFAFGLGIGGYRYGCDYYYTPYSCVPAYSYYPIRSCYPTYHYKYEFYTPYCDSYFGAGSLRYAGLEEPPFYDPFVDDPYLDGSYETVPVEYDEVPPFDDDDYYYEDTLSDGGSYIEDVYSSGLEGGCSTTGLVTRVHDPRYDSYPAAYGGLTLGWE